METTHNISLLWNVFNRLLVSHVLFGAVLSNVGRGGLSWTNCKFCHDDYVWSDIYDCGCSVCECAFLR